MPIRQYFFIRLTLILFLCAADAVALEVGHPLPVCSLSSLEDKQSIDFSDLRGQVIYVDFWASWCGPCAKSFPFMNTLHGSLQEKGLRILAINVDEDIADAERFLRDLPATFQIGRDSDSQCARAFDVQAMPSTFLVDRKGVVRYVHLGFRASDAETLQREVDQLLQESP